MIGEDHLHLIEKGQIQEWNHVANHTLMLQPQKKHYQCKNKTFYLINSTQII